MTILDGLRIGLIGPLPPPAGGMANQTCQLAELLRSAGATVELVQSNAPYRPAWVGRVPVVRALFRLLPYLVSLWICAGRSQLFHVMANSGWSWHLFAAPAIRIAVWRGVPVVVNYRGGEAGPFLERSHASVQRSLQHVAILAVPSGFLQQVFAQHALPSCVLPNIVDLARFRPAPEGRVRGAHVVVARNLEAIYDNAGAVKALAGLLKTHPACRLTIAGTGPEERNLRELARSLGLADSVHLVGRLDRDAVADLYRDADVVLNPSTVDNTPNSVLEAMASGVPVVSTNVGGVPYLVQDGVTALLVPPGDPVAMAAALRRVLDDPELAQALAAAALVDVKRYEWGQVSAQLARIYHKACAARARPV